MTAGAQRELITLAVPTTIHVIGEVVEGEIFLNFAELQNTQIEELHVKLRGSVATYAYYLFSASTR